MFEMSLFSLSFYYFNFVSIFDYVAKKLCYLFVSSGELGNGFSYTFLEHAANLKVDNV